MLQSSSAKLIIYHIAINISLIFSSSSFHKYNNLIFLHTRCVHYLDMNNLQKKLKINN